MINKLGNIANVFCDDGASFKRKLGQYHPTSHANNMICCYRSTEYYIIVNKKKSGYSFLVLHVLLTLTIYS